MMQNIKANYDEVWEEGKRDEVYKKRESMADDETKRVRDSN